MKTNICLFLSLCILPSLALAGVGGASDKREVIGWYGNKPDYYDKNAKNIWNTYPYKNIVLIIGSWGAGGTGEFISPRHILTNTHVAKGCGIDDQTKCSIYLSDGSSYSAKVVLFGGINKTDDTISKDWSVLEIVDDNFCRSEYFDYISPTRIGSGLWRAGFGGLRVLTNEDIKNIKSAYWKWLGKVYPHNFISRTQDYKSAINLHWRKYDIHDDSSKYTTFLTEFKNLTGRDFMYEYLSDGHTLKLIHNCGINTIYSGVGVHNCQSWAGDSGSSVMNSSNKIVLLNRGGERYITSKEEYVNFGPVTQKIFGEKTLALIKQAKEKCQSTKTNIQPKPGSKSSPTPEPTPTSNPDSNERNIGMTCLKTDLPPHATAGHYIKSGLKKYDCTNGQTCSCAATECESGYYLVVNASGNSQGWCYTRRCPSGQHLNIIDGYKTNTKCVDN